MIARLGKVLNRVARRVVPDPFILALGLTLLVLVLGWVTLNSRSGASAAHNLWTVLGGWYQGFKNPSGLAFALQMCLVLVTGHALALAPAVQRRISILARLPRNTASAAAMVALTACVAAIIHWGLGAIVGALLAREIMRDANRRKVRLHYPVLGAAAYAGMAVWHGGVSGSAPLKVAESGHFVESLIGVMPVSETLFSTLNLVVTGTLLIMIPLAFWLLARRDPDEPVPEPVKEAEPIVLVEPETGTGVLGWLHHSPWVGATIGALGLTFIVAAGCTRRMGFDLNSVNLTFLFLGLTLHGRVRGYLKAITDGAKGAGAIVLQFPFYFGILGVMQASGLIYEISEAFVSMANAVTFPVLTFLSAGLVNFFVPSGGGQWAVQAEILLRAGDSLGVSPATTIMAFSYGDAWTNMLQPFWALPLLGIMGLRARDIIGYTAVILLLMAVVVPALLLLMV